MIPRRKAHTCPGEFAEIARLCRSVDTYDETVVAEWERAMAAYVGVAHGASVNSGRRGMTLILEHLGVGVDDEVIVPAYTLKDLIPLIQELGAHVVPADIDPETLTISPDTIRARLSRRTKAILALHAFGAPCAIEEIVALGNCSGVPVVEDCAHSLGATVRGRQTGSFGRAGFFSFETTKPINTFGGGMVVSDDTSLIEHIRKVTRSDAPDRQLLRKKVRATRLERGMFATGMAFPFLCFLATPGFKQTIARIYRRVQHAPPNHVRYSPIQARLGLSKLATLDRRIESRRRKAELLRGLLRPEVRPQRLLDGSASSWYFLVVVLPGTAAAVRNRLLARGIDAGIEDEIADNCAALLGFRDCPNTERIYRRAIALPLYEDLPEEKVRRVAKTLNGLIS